MPPYIDVFVSPLRDSLPAQVAVVALLALTVLDMLFGSVSAAFITRDFKTHVFRQGLVRKLMNLGMTCVADVVDGMLIGGLQLPFVPQGSVFVVVSGALAVMELWSLCEIYAESHPEVSEAAWFQMLARSKEGLHE